MTQNGDAYANAHVGRTDTVVVDERVCFARACRARPQALAVSDRRHEPSPPVVKRDPNREPNASFNPRGAYR